MPAREHEFSELLPDRLYLDTDILVGHLTVGHPNHERAQGLLNRLVRGKTTVFLSSLCWLEFAQAVIRASFRQALPNETRRRLSANSWEQRSVRHRYLEAFIGLLHDALQQFEWEEVPLTQDVRDLALDLMAEFALRSYDAVHVASAQLAGVSDLASFDAAFRRVDGLHLWNDRIHTPRT